jgi:hypothetical protein
MFGRGTFNYELASIINGSMEDTEEQDLLR